MGCAKMLRIIDALTGVFASSAEEPGAHAPSVRRVPARSVAPPRTRAIRVEIPTWDASSVVDDEGMEREALELVATVEEGELDQERHADDVAPELLDQPERRGHRAARGEQVIDGEYALPRLDRVLVDGQRVAPGLELVLDLDGLARELAELPHGDETRAQLVGERPAEDEPTRLDGDHDVHALLLIAAREHVDHVAERRTVLEKGGDVLEEDPLGWEVPDVTDLRPEVGDVHRAPILRAPCRSAQDGRRATAPTCPRDTQWTAIRQVTDERLTRAAAQPTNFLAPMPRGVLRGTQLASFESEASFDTRHPCCSRSKSTGSSDSPWSSSRPTGRSAEPARSSVYTGRSTGLPASGRVGSSSTTGCPAPRRFSAGGRESSRTRPTTVASRIASSRHTPTGSRTRSGAPSRRSASSPRRRRGSRSRRRAPASSTPDASPARRLPHRPTATPLTRAVRSRPASRRAAGARRRDATGRPPATLRS